MASEKLRELLVKQEDVLEDLILDSLRGIVSLDSKSGEIYPTERYGKLKPEAKICVFLMARKAANLLGLNGADSASATTIKERTGMPVGIVNPKLRNLFGKGIIAQNEEKEYYMLFHGFAFACEIIRGGEGNEP